MKETSIGYLAGIIALTMAIESQAGVVGHAVSAQVNTAQSTVTQSASEGSTAANPYGAWASDAKGWWWRNPDGTWPKNTWAWLDGNHDGVSESYYFGADGYMLSNTVTPDGYTVNANGAWTQNGVVQTKTSGVPTLYSTTTTTNNVTYTTSGSSSSSNTATTDVSEFQEKVVELVNKERRKAGKSELVEDDTLDEIAMERAEECTEKFSHTRPDGSDCFSLWDEYGVGDGYCGENIAKGYATPEAVVKGWMNSSGHRANILSSNFDSIGVGFAKSGSGYCWAQAFTG